MSINLKNDIDNLPSAYQLYPNGNQNCLNCGAYQPSGNCTVWNAIVQEFAWCKKWISKADG
jgi:hypothetical protein